MFLCTEIASRGNIQYGKTRTAQVPIALLRALMVDLGKVPGDDVGHMPVRCGHVSSPFFEHRHQQDIYSTLAFRDVFSH